jgi:tetratricopeptide (TPR) repeat protein
MKKNVLDRRAELSRYREAVKENPSSPDAHFRLGTALIQVGFLSEGQAALERSLELDPDRVEAWVNLGGARLGRWDFAGCLQANQQALDREPGLARAYFNQGLAHMYLGAAEEMVSCLKKVLELEPDNALGHYHMAVGLHALGQEDEARTYLAKAVGLGHSPDPSFVKVLEQKDAPGPVHVIEVGPGPDGQDDEDKES